MAIGAMLWHALLIIRIWPAWITGVNKQARHGVVVNALDILRFSFGWVSGTRFFFFLRDRLQGLPARLVRWYEKRSDCTERSGLLIEYGTTQN